MSPAPLERAGALLRRAAEPGRHPSAIGCNGSAPKLYAHRAPDERNRLGTSPMIVAFHSPEEVAGVLAVLRPLGYRWEPIGAVAAGPDPAVGGDYLFTP